MRSVGPPPDPYPRATVRPTALLVGCGDLGTEIGLRLMADGATVLGLRRRIEALPKDFHGLSVDLTRDRPDLPQGDYETLVVALTADSRDDEAYRETYLGGLQRALDALEHAGRTPRRAVLVSSTGVYGDRSRGEEVLDETSPLSPSRPTHEVLLSAEEMFTGRLPHGIVLRLSGLYGPGRSTFIGRAREGTVTPRWTNRIHRDDAAAAVVHLLGRSGPRSTDGHSGTSDGPDGGLYLGTDTRPALSTEVAAFIRRHEGWPPVDFPTPDPTGAPGRRLTSAKLRSTGFSFTYPTYREGYAAVLEGRGRRHS